MGDHALPCSVKDGGIRPPRLIVCGVRIDAYTLDSATDYVIEAARTREPVGVHLCNAYTLSLARSDPGFQVKLNESEANFCDGMPLVWLVRRLGLEDMRRRVYGPDLMASVMDKGRATGIAHYLYGSTANVLDQLRIELERRYPGVKIAGAESPPFRSLSESEQQEVVDRIRTSGADVVWVGLGTPKQDRFVEDYKKRIGLPLVAVGAAFDFHAGSVAQAPLLLQNTGLEWAYRLMREPRRLWRRYLFGNASFVRGVITGGTVVEEDVDVTLSPPPAKLVMVSTSHNRRELTVQFLQSMGAQEGDLDLHLILVDDGSTDGTGEMVRRSFPDVEVIDGDGSLFWAGGMRVALERAHARDPDYVVWANDDVALEPDAIQRLLATYASLCRLGRTCSIVVGAMADPATGATTYSGARRRIHRTRFRTLPPVQDRARRAETFHGNLVLIPRSVFRVLGNIDPAFQHAMGDFDYGLRAQTAGCEVWVAPGHVGTCARAPTDPLWRGRSTPVRQRLRALRSRKGLPTHDWYVFTRRHTGPLWPLYWAAPFVSALLARRERS